MPAYEVFTFRGISSDSMGVLMSTEWLDSIPAMRHEQIEIEGRDGAIYRELGYSDIVIDIPCVLRSSAHKEALKGWLTGSGAFVFNGRQKHARIYDQIDFQRIGTDGESFSIPFILEPYWLAEGCDSWINLGTISAGETLQDAFSNLGNVPAAPRIRITPVGDTLTFSLTYQNPDGSGIYEFIIEVDCTQLSGQSLEIDCEAKTESDPGAVTMGYRYPLIGPGAVSIAVTTGQAVFEVCRKDRWI